MKRAGRPPKADGGMASVLFVRCSPWMLRRIDDEVEAERARHPGRSISRADVVREILARNLEVTTENT